VNSRNHALQQRVMPLEPSGLSRFSKMEHEEPLWFPVSATAALDLGAKPEQFQN
jgi:hypothetical protein